MMRFIALALCALVLSSCRNNANNVVLASLNRSAKIQFLCADLELITGNLYDLREVLPTSLCSTETTFAPEIQAQFLGAVTQIQTGEVAVISFTNDFILDTNRTVPGVTALRVGEQPTGIQISPFASNYTYVTNFSPKSLQAIETGQLITGASVLEPDEVRFDAGPTDLALQESAFAMPTMEDGQVTGADSGFTYRYLYAAIPELGEVVQVEIDPNTGKPVRDLDGSPVITELPLDTFQCPVTQVPAPPSNDADYNRICPQASEDDPGRFIKTVVTTEPCAEGTTSGPSPVALAIDRGVEQGDGSAMDTGSDEDNVLLVADANQPVIHRFALGADGATAMDPIITGTPTTDIDVTPLVPASSDPADQAATQRYLYAVSATDSSVLVIDYTEELDGMPNETFGAVLPVIAGISPRANEENVESRDRVRFAFSNVRAIEVVSPFYQLEEDPDSDGMQVPADDICTASDADAFASAQTAANMRGVFLAVSLSDGTMFFLDIYDLNAPCRGGEGTNSCTIRETGTDRLASIRRHRRRFNLTPPTFIEIDGNPSLQFNASTGRLDETTGDAVNSDGPGLEFINCPPSMDPERSSMLDVFGAPPDTSTDGLICASSQVWSSLSQQWEAQWEGLIPQSEGGLGLFADASLPLPPDGEIEPGNWFQAGDVPFCQVGVLGPQGPDAAPVPSYVGDRLLITGELPPSTRDEPACEEFLELEDEIDDRPVWFPIVRAFNDQLEIGPSPNPSRYTLDEVRDCFTQFTEYQIHTNDAYTVTGTTSGFIHRVIPDETTGECILDDERPVVLDDVDTYLTGRAFEDTQFINPLVSFQIGPFPPETSVTDATFALLNFAITNQFVPLFLDTSTSVRSLPSSMLFSAQQDQLFFVDLEAGVRRITFSPLNFAQTFE
jgi:hypothetical protein